MIQRGAIAMVVSSAVLFGAPAAANAVVTVGSNFAGTPNTAPAVNTSLTQNTQPAAGTLPVSSPISGVIVRLRIKHGMSGADPGVYGFRVLTGAPTNFATNGAPAELPDFTWPANDTPGIRTYQPKAGTIPKGIPIRTNDRVGITRLSGTPGQGAQMFTFDGSAGAALGAATGAHNSGTATYLSQPNQELLLQYDVEPDADNDGFGDETQDGCVNQTGTVRGCPSITVPAPCKKGTVKKKRKCVKKKRKKRKK